MLSRKDRTRTDEYVCSFSRGFDGYYKATIVFVDGVFKRATFDFSGNYTRDQWKVLAEIAEQIEIIEESYKEKDNG